MKKIAAIILLAAMLVALPSLALAQEPAKYNFASAQGSKQIPVIPGSEGKGVIYFYNIDGNRITHITLEVTEAPDNWEVEIEPPLGEIQVEIGGRIVSVTENLHVEPSEVSSEEIKDIPEGMVCITVPNRGYALAKAAYIVVRVPEGEEIGAKGEISISGVAEWLGQTGAAAIKQSRDFDFTGEVVPEAGGEERIIEEGGEGGSSEAVEAAGEGAGSTPSGFAAIINRWLPVIIAAVIAILAAILIPRLRRRRE